MNVLHNQISLVLDLITKILTKPEPTQSHYLRITNINCQMDKIRDKATYTTTQTLNEKLKVSSMLTTFLCFAS
jgi:hypothetical protein